MIEIILYVTAGTLPAAVARLKFRAASLQRSIKVCKDRLRIDGYRDSHRLAGAIGCTHRYNRVDYIDRGGSGVCPCVVCYDICREPVTGGRRACRCA
ncbi:MAG: hypothetical protein IPI69_03100 [Bacteroidales bacterium]|nr:hypothetical protein [Bacteroidales bacterium]